MNANIIVSIILGIIASSVIFYFLNMSTNIIYRGPDSKIIKSHIYRLKKENKCYVLQPKIYLCPK